MPARWLLAVLLSSLFCVATLRLAGHNAAQRLAPGSLLVASEKLNDPNFVESVVLILHRDEDGGTLGVVLNRQADVTLAKAFPNLHAKADPVYEGGPVAPDAVQGLLRSPSKIESLEPLAGDIYAVSSKALLEKSISARLPAERFRIYLGYAGWGPGQLENEIRQGAWNTAYGLKYVFDNEPDSLWQRLNRDSQSQVATGNSGFHDHATMEACRCFAPLVWRYSPLFAPPPSPPPSWCCASKITPSLPN